MSDRSKTRPSGWFTTKEERAVAISESEQPTGIWWRETALRIALMSVVALTVEFLLGAGPWGRGSIHPHPYWFLVLPVAASRGLVAGLLAAAAATLFVIAGAAVGGSFALDRETLAEPLVFFAAAILVGELRDLLRERVRHLTTERDELAKGLERAGHDREVLETTIRELERRLARGPGDLGTLIAATRRVESSDRSELFGLALEMIVEHVADAASVIEVDESGALKRAHVVGEARRDDAELRGSPLVEHVLRRGEPMSAFDAPRGDLPAGPCMVAPILDHGRRVVALLTLDDLAPERLQPGTASLFASIAEWASYGLSRIAAEASPLAISELAAAKSGDAQRRRSIRLQSATDLPFRLRHEFARCDRNNVNLSVVGLQFVVDGDIDSSRSDQMDALVLEHLAVGLRDADGVHSFGYPGCYAFILPATGLEGAGAIRARLEHVASRVERQVAARAVFTVAGPEHSEFTSDRVLDSLALTFRGHARRPLGLPSREERDPRVLGTVDALADRLAVEHSMALRFGYDFQLLGVDFSASNVPLDSDRLPDPVYRACNRALRLGVEGFLLTEGHAVFLVPGLEADAKHLVAERLAGALANNGVGGAGVQWLFDSMETPDVARLVRTLLTGSAT